MRATVVQRKDSVVGPKDGNRYLVDDEGAWGTDRKVVDVANGDKFWHRF